MYKSPLIWPAPCRWTLEVVSNFTLIYKKLTVNSNSVSTIKENRVRERVRNWELMLGAGEGLLLLPLLFSPLLPSQWNLRGKDVEGWPDGRAPCLCHPQRVPMSERNPSYTHPV